MYVTYLKFFTQLFQDSYDQLDQFFSITVLNRFCWIFLVVLLLLAY